MSFQDLRVTIKRFLPVKKGLSLNLLFVGDSGSGKTSLINSLFSDLFPVIVPTSPTTILNHKTGMIQEGELILSVTITDTPPVCESFQQIINYIDQQFDRSVN